MRRSTSIRGSVRPSVRPSVRRSVRRSVAPSLIDDFRNTWCRVYGLVGWKSFAKKLISIDAFSYSRFFTGGDLAHEDFCHYNWHWDDSYDCSMRPALLSLTALMLLDAVVVFVISIWAIATNSIAIQKAKACACCACCDESTPTPQAPIVVYLPANQVRTFTLAS